MRKKCILATTHVRCQSGISQVLSQHIRHRASLSATEGFFGFDSSFHFAPYSRGGGADWLSIGTVQTHGKFPADRPNKNIRLVGHFANLYSLIPERFGEEARETFASWSNEFLTTNIQATKMIRMDVRLDGVNPDQYAMRSRRRGGAAALYRDTGDLDLAATYGRWKGNSTH